MPIVALRYDLRAPAFANVTHADLYRTACQIAIQVLTGKWPDAVVNPEVKNQILNL